MTTMMSSEDWITCDCGREHWGIFGAAGILVVRLDASEKVSHVLLQHRALWVDQGGTWGIPGGALHYGETAVDGALREACEEIDVAPQTVQVIGKSVLDHGNWSYTTVVAVPTEGFAFQSDEDESLAVEWVSVADIHALPLHSGFASGWNVLHEKINAKSL